MNLVTRVQRILFQPKQEWPVIEAEPTTVAQIYMGYVLPLCVIGPLASLIGMTVFGVRLPFGGSFRISVGSALASAVISYVLALVSVFILALIIDALAPAFGGQKNSIQALKVAAYSSTAAWVAGIFGLIPMLSILGILGLYGLYLLYLGLPVLMKAPQEKAIGYTVVVIVCAIVLFFVVGMVAAIPLGLRGMMPSGM
jgi:hypothetical protein